MRFKLCFIMIFIFIFASCAARTVPKTQFAVFMDDNDWETYLAEYFEKMPEEQRWNNCFDISDAEFKKQILEIYAECRNDFMERKYPKLPNKITQYEINEATKTIDQCAKIKFVVRNKDKFVLDKHTENFDHCLNMYDQLIKKMK